MSNPPKKSEVEFGFEAISRALDSGLADLTVADWMEVTVGLDLPPLAIDWKAYLTAERRGEYRGIAARRDGNLVGYNGYDVFRPKRHTHTLMAFGDAMYLDPRERKGLVAFRFLRESEKLLKSIGVQWVVKGDMGFANLATPKPRASFSDMLERIGYSPYDRSMIKRL